MKLKVLLLNTTFCLIVIRSILISVLCFSSFSTWAFEQTNKGCALSGWEIYKIIEHAQNGTTKKQQLNTLSKSFETRKNIDFAYNTIRNYGYSGAYDSLHVFLIECRQEIKEENKKLEPDYLKCTRQASLRIHILTDIKHKKSLSDMYKKYGQYNRDLVEMLNKSTANYGYLDTVKLSASGFAECVSKVVMQSS